MEKKKIFAVLALIIAAFLAGRYLVPKKIKEVKIVEVDKHVDSDKTKHTIHRPDGTVETVVSEHSHTDSSKHSETSKEVSYDSNSWLVSGYMGVQRKGLSFNLDSSQTMLSIQRHILWGIYAGPYVTVNGDFGMGVSVRF